MVVRGDLVFDDESEDDADESPARIGRVVAGGVALLAIAVAVVVSISSGPARLEGTQAAPADSVELGRAESIGWQPLAPMSGEPRAGYPAPMVLMTDRVCVGFERLDFDPDYRRPSIARCDADRAGGLAVNEIRSIVSIKAGFDTWHFIQAAEPISSIEVSLADGERVSGDRIFLSGSIGALQLENSRDLETVEWSTRSSTFRCGPDPTAWRTSVFCAERP